MASPVLALADEAGPSAPVRGVAGVPLPEIASGELWFVELAAAAALSADERRLVAAANVVIYDRSLTALVAAILPLGGYAEPAALLDAEATERCRRFARDGWSVVRLAGASRHGPARTERLRRLGGGAAPRVLADGAGRLIAAFPRLGNGIAPAAAGIAGNGLAG